MYRVHLFDFMLCFVLIGFTTAQFQQNVGDSCRLTSGGIGVCKLFDNCDLNLLNQEKPEPAICAWLPDEAVVCCPSSGSPPPRPSPPRPPLISRGSSKSTQKCQEYKKEKDIYYTGLILGGEDVKSVEQYPHMALLGYGNPPTWQCGGTLISEQFILTAAHCLNGNDRSPVTTAHLGFLDKRNRNAFGTLQEFRIVQTFKHPDRKAPKKYADLALLKLDRPVQYSRGVVPACLHEDFNLPVDRAQAIGWGDLTTGSRTGSDILQKVTISISSHEDCSNKYPIDRKLPQGIDRDSQFCAGETGKDTCQGDSGGPLQIVDTSGMAKIIGVTSIGQLCGVVPGVYTRVSHYVPWIESVVWPN